MTKMSIIANLVSKGYNPTKDLDISKGGTVYKYNCSKGVTKRLYIVESNSTNPFFGITKNVVARLVAKHDDFCALFIATKNQESYIVNKNNIVTLYNGNIMYHINTDKSGNYKLPSFEMCKLNATYYKDDDLLSAFINTL